MKVKVSIIIPVYNVITYLEECINSVLAQTYQDLEILMVDDGSTDGSGVACDGYAGMDDRIRVIHKKNGGLSDARNAGMAVSTGDYLYFLDSDDVIAPNTIAHMVQCLDDQVDIVIAGVRSFSERYSFVADDVTNHAEVLTSVETIRRMLLPGGIGHTACGKLYARSLWLDERFPKGMLYEDYATTYRIVGKCKKTAVLDETLYYYRARTGSIMRSRIQERNLMLLDISDDVTRYITERFPQIRHEAEYLQLRTYLKLMKGILDAGYRSFPDTQNRIIQYIKAHRYLLNCSWFRNKDRIKVITLLVNRRLFYLVYTIGERSNQSQLQ